MKLHEEFKLFETLWEEVSPAQRALEIKAEIERLQQELSSLDLEEVTTSSVTVEVPGTSKKLERKGVSNREALDALINFIKGLSLEEKQKVEFYWYNDNLVAGDGDGDILLNRDSGEDIINNLWTAIAPMPADALDKIEAALGF